MCGNPVYGKGLLNVGSCGLHQLHNAFKGAFASSTTSSKKLQGCDWNMGHFLTALDALFTDCPARRADYDSINEGTTVVYPKNVCTHRWLEKSQTSPEGD